MARKNTNFNLHFLSFWVCARWQNDEKNSMTVSFRTILCVRSDRRRQPREFLYLCQRCILQNPDVLGYKGNPLCLKTLDVRISAVSFMRRPLDNFWAARRTKAASGRTGPMPIRLRFSSDSSTSSLCAPIWRHEACRHCSDYRRSQFVSQHCQVFLREAISRRRSTHECHRPAIPDVRGSNKKKKESK